MNYKNNKSLDEHLVAKETPKKVYPKYWYLLTLATTLVLGFVCAYFFPELCPPISMVGGNWGTRTYYGFLGLFLLNIAWLLVINTTKRNDYIKVYNLNTILIWLGFSVGWGLVFDEYLHDIFMHNGVGTLLGMGIGSLILYVQNQRAG